MTSDTDALNNTTGHTYNQQARTDTVQYPVPGVQAIIAQNVFEETVKRTDGLGNSQLTTHEPDGQVLTATDELGNVTTDNSRCLRSSQSTSRSHGDYYKNSIGCGR